MRKGREMSCFLSTPKSQSILAHFYSPPDPEGKESLSEHSQDTTVVLYNAWLLN
jgi:hypothetical protein